jgi:hypothetical protein
MAYYFWQHWTHAEAFILRTWTHAEAFILRTYLYISSDMALYACGGIYWTHAEMFTSRAQRERAGTPVAPGCVEHVHQRQQYLHRNSTCVREDIKEQKFKDFRGSLTRKHTVSNSIPPCLCRSLRPPPPSLLSDISSVRIPVSPVLARPGAVLISPHRSSSCAHGHSGFRVWMKMAGWMFKHAEVGRGGDGRG